MCIRDSPHINEVWCGDSSVGPRLTDSDGKKHRIYIIALIEMCIRDSHGIDVNDKRVLRICRKLNIKSTIILTTGAQDRLQALSI